MTAESRGASRRQRAERRIDAQIGRRLREARRLAGATPQQLAEALGVTAQALQKYETGARRLTAAQMAAAVKFLGVPMSFLIKEDTASAVTMADAGLTPVEIELVQCFRAIADDALRQRVLRLAKAASEAALPEE
ncbi:MAG TPA: helix-turn-helix transcriptional regulator [Stellaceae bacterium]|nr:helix-turn-helix transcriptional regulator [Stellaceae bacterium]